MRNEWDERLSRTRAADLNMVVFCFGCGVVCNAMMCQLARLLATVLHPGGSFKGVF